ncbi:MAG TPA: DNA polymerase I [Candidatus Cybelea sp.]|nr:DNA polymerase I [Candidatus Cybelea sp.]
MLLDTYGLVYRAFFALPGLTTSAGTPINAVYGFTMMLNKLIADEKPTHVLAAFDKGMPAERVALFAQYKAQRRAMPDELRGQFALVRQVLATYRIPVVEVEGQEADDVIATLARQAQEAGEQTIVVTGDLDLLQIVNDRVTVLVTRRGITELGRYDPLAVRERFGLEPAQLPDYRGLKGDPSDNLPGIPGVGEKTASKLLAAAGSLDALVSNPALAGNPKLERLIEEYGQQACLCRAVSIVRRDLPLSVDWDESRYVAPPGHELYRLYSELEFKTLLARLQPPDSLPLLETAAKVTGNYRSYVPSVDPPEFAQLAGELVSLRGAGQVVLAQLGGAIGATAREGEGIAFSADALSQENVREAARAIVGGSSRAGGYDVKKLLHVLHSAGIDGRFSDDAMIAAHLLDPARGFADVEDAALQFLGYGLPSDPAAAADATLRLIAKTRAELEQRGQLQLYEELELPLAPVLARMEETGVAIDTNELRIIGDRVDTAAEQLRKHIFDFAGEEFNIGSPQQLGKVLFGKLNIPGGKKTKTGWATGVEVLQGLARDYPICALVLEWREVTKLKNTYVDVIPQLVDPRDGRLRTEFNQTATATGRLSSTNPNLQNIPVRGELGRRIRRAFVAKSDAYVLLAADYSQIELRLMAHLSGDEAMRRAFAQSQDIHDFTARQIFGIAPGVPVDPNQRRMAKSVNFGLFYGMSDFGLAQRLEIGRAEAKEITTAYFARFPDVRAYIDRTLEDGRRNGYVSTIAGRRRYMPGLTSGNYMLRAAAEREATNAPLQGSAADLMKLAMVRIDRALQNSGLDATMLLQIHDELIFEVRATQLSATVDLVRSQMESAVELSVPLEVTLKAGRNWYDAEAINEETFEHV